MTGTAPVLFPEIEGPEFLKSEQVADVARDVLSEHGKVGGVGRLFATAKAVREGEIRIAYLINAKPFDELNDDANHDAAGKCIKAPRLWHDVTGIDVAIWIREHFWKGWPPDVRAAAVLHELLHVEVDHDAKGEVKIKVRKHDVEDFVDVVRIYGPIFGYAEGGTPALVRAANLFADAHRREPRKLRPVEPAPDADSGTIDQDDDVDVRPTGEINADELHGAAANDVAEAERSTDGSDLDDLPF